MDPRNGDHIASPYRGRHVKEYTELFGKGVKPQLCAIA
jgi:hypothetical protein